MAEKVIETFPASMSTETVSVNVTGETADHIQKVVITNTQTGEVVSSQTLRNSMPTEDAWSIIQEASGR